MTRDREEKRGMSRRGFLKATGMAGVGTAILSSGFSAPVLPAADGPGEGKPNAPALPKRRLGKTGKEVSILCLGGMIDTINNQLLLKQAFNWGVTCWDTAEAYGDGMSEDGMGRWFSRNPGTRKDIYLITKSRRRNGKDLSEDLDKSLQRLKTDYVDLFFLHNLTGADSDTLSDGTREWATAMKKAGKINAFGFSTHSNMEDCLLGASRLDWIDAILFSYNFRLMQTDKMKEAVSACIKADIGLLAMKTQGGGPVKTDSEVELQLAGRFLDRGFTDKQARLKAVWENSAIATICSQMPSLTILMANVAAARNQTQLAQMDLDLFARYARETRHGYCAGCTSICTEALAGQVPVSDVMRYLMYYQDYGERDLARAHFASLPEDVKERMTRIDYGPAERCCPQGLAIADLMRSAAALLV